MPAKISLIGQTFGKLKVIGDAPRKYFPGGQSHRQSECLCECGNIFVTCNHSLRDGRTKSCGCLSVEMTKARETIHGHNRIGKRTSTYRAWSAMWQRCTNPNMDKFPYYGGKGIKVHAPWKDFVCFLNDMGECPPKLTLERIDTNGNYCPENCKWATRTEQMRNRSNNRMETFRGTTACLSQLCEKFHADYKPVELRLSRGWTLERAFTQPRRITRNTRATV